MYSFAGRTELRFDPSVAPFLNPGLAASTTGIVTLAILGDERTYFDVALFGLHGQLISALRMRRELTFQIGAAVYRFAICAFNDAAIAGKSIRVMLSPASCSDSMRCRPATT